MNKTTDSALTRIFARSPFSALFSHIDAVQEGATQLTAFFEAARDDDWDEATRRHDAIVAAEHRADDLKDDIRLHLPRRLFLPISRGDLLQLIEAQDKIINKIKDISGLMLGRRISFPDEIAQPLHDYAQTAIKAVAESHALLGEFNELLDAGFAGDAGDLVAESIERLAALEKQSDDQQVAIRQQLLAVEPHLPPLDVMFIYRVIDWIGNLADRAERVGTRLQILVTH